MTDISNHFNIKVGGQLLKFIFFIRGNTSWFSAAESTGLSEDYNCFSRHPLSCGVHIKFPRMTHIHAHIHTHTHMHTYMVQLILRLEILILFGSITQTASFFFISCFTYIFVNMQEQWVSFRNHVKLRFSLQVTGSWSVKCWYWVLVTSDW